MKKNYKGFSFIELVVVVSILALTSIFTISWFSKNFEKNALLQQANSLNILLWDLDNQIGNDITDYSLFLSTDNSFYFWTTNTYYKNIVNEISFLWFSWTLKTNSTTNGNNYIKLYFENKLQKNDTISFTWSYTQDFSNIWKYVIKSKSDLSNLNDIFINYFSIDKEESTINLKSIKNESENTYTWITIKNWIGQTREFFDYSGNIITNKIILTFDNWKIEANLELTK